MPRTQYHVYYAHEPAQKLFWVLAIWSSKRKWRPEPRVLQGLRQELAPRGTSASSAYAAERVGARSSRIVARQRRGRGPDGSQAAQSIVIGPPRELVDHQAPDRRHEHRRRSSRSGAPSPGAPPNPGRPGGDPLAEQLGELPAREPHRLPLELERLGRPNPRPGERAPRRPARSARRSPPSMIFLAARRAILRRQLRREPMAVDHQHLGRRAGHELGVLAVRQRATQRGNRGVPWARPVKPGLRRR